MTDQNTLSMIVRVNRKTLEADNIASFELIDPHGRPLPAFSAGAHIDVNVKNGTVRQYSLCNPSGQSQSDCYKIAVLRDPNSRGGSTAMHDEIQEGDLIQISAPKNHFPLTESPRTLLLAGGIGVTPILAMAEHLSSSDADFTMHYCTRSPSATAFRDLIATSQYSDRVRFHHDDGPDEQKLDLPSLVAEPNPDTHVYVCGPSGFIDYVLTTCKEKGWDTSQLHTEYFASAPVDTSEDTSFDVKIASSGEVYEVPPGKTVYEVLSENGVEIIVSCEQGVCGTCLTGILEGTPDHRDHYLDEGEHAANDQFTPCCSRAKSKMLVLDL